MGIFAINMRKWTEKTNQNIGQAVREVVMTVHANADLRSPVGDSERWADNIARASRGLPALPAGYIGGHFRANNQYKFGSPPTGEIEGVDPTGSTALAAIRAGVYAAPVAGLHYIANNVPYAQALENGHSTQAPKGIYKLATIDTETVMRSMM